MAKEFIVPDFIQGNSPEDIQERMMNNLPADIDDMPGGFPYDFTMPTALEKSELIQFHLVRTLMLMFPQFAWGEWLDLHGETAGVTRKEAGFASGYVTFEGIPGTKIKKGFIVCTPATDTSSSLEFATDEEAEIEANGNVTIALTAALAGNESNVPANAVSLMTKPMNGVTRIWNQEKISGGTNEEDDESYYERIQEKNQSKDTSNVGNDGDYIRWAKEVVGVGDAITVAEWNGPGTVKLIVIDSNGMAANDKILNDVYLYIISPEDRINRKAPIGATLTVVAPNERTLTYSGKIILSLDANLDYVKEEFKKSIQKHYEIAKKEGILRYTKVHSVLSGIYGVDDFLDFKVNGGQNNVTLGDEEYPTTGEVLFEVGDTS